MAFEKVSLQTWMDVNNLKMKNIDIILMTTEKNYEEIKLPVRGTKKSAGYDFICPFDSISLEPGTTYLIPTGIKASLDKICPYIDNSDQSNTDKEIKFLDINAYIALYPRSSLGMKYGFTLLNTTGIIDADYYNNESNEGHIMVAFKVSKTLELKKGDKFCQGIITPFYVMEDDNVIETLRTGGMGSTN